MDPIVCLQEARRLSAKIDHTYREIDGNGIDQEEANSLAVSFIALDEWIKKGGFNPWATAENQENTRLRTQALLDFVETVDATGGVIYSSSHKEAALTKTPDTSPQ